MLATGRIYIVFIKVSSFSYIYEKLPGGYENIFLNRYF